VCTSVFSDTACDAPSSGHDADVSGDLSSSSLHDLLEFLKIFLRVCSGLDYRAGFNSCGDFFPFFSVDVERGKKCLVFFFGPTPGVFLP